MTTKLKLTFLGTAIAALAAGVAIAQTATTPAAPAAPVSLLSAALAEASVGEQHDGYMGFRSTPSPALRKEVDALNIKRRAVYTDMAQTRTPIVTPKEVAAAVGCETLSKRVAVGRAYLLEDNVWRVRKAGETIKLPAYCGV